MPNKRFTPSYRSAHSMRASALIQTPKGTPKMTLRGHISEDLDDSEKKSWLAQFPPDATDQRFNILPYKGRTPRAKHATLPTERN